MLKVDSATGFWVAVFSVTDSLVFIRELSCKSKLRFTCAVLIIGERPEIFAGATIEISVKKGDPHNFHHEPRFLRNIHSELGFSLYGPAQVIKEFVILGGRLRT